jgi:hypothetical protein
LNGGQGSEEGDAARRAVSDRGLAMLRRFAADRRGNMAFMMIVTLVGVALIAGGVVDYSSLVSQRMNVKEAANRAALAAASEMLLVGASEQGALSVAQAIVRNNLGDDQAEVSLIRPEEDQFGVSVSVRPRTFFPGPVSLAAQTIVETSVAEIAGDGNVCVVALDDDGAAALNFAKDANLAAGGCLVYVNSTHPTALKLHPHASVMADFVCVSGGVSGPEEVVSGDVLSDCPPVSDPLANRPVPPASSPNCANVTAMTLAAGNFILAHNWRLFCANLTVGPAATLRIKGGIVTFRNSRFVVQGKLFGDGAGLVFTGASSGFSFEPGSQIRLSAPTTGPMAGLLAFQRDAAATPNSIRSDKAERLVGTIYTPNSTLVIDSASGKVAEQSEYTVIVAGNIELGGGPDLVLNTNYGASSVPVPEGLGNNARNSVRLSH